MKKNTCGLNFEPDFLVKFPCKGLFRVIWQDPLAHELLLLLLEVRIGFGAWVFFGFRLLFGDLCEVEDSPLVQVSGQYLAF